MRLWADVYFGLIFLLNRRHQRLLNPPQLGCSRPVVIRPARRFYWRQGDCGRAVVDWSASDDDGSVKTLGRNKRLPTTSCSAQYQYIQLKHTMPRSQEEKSWRLIRVDSSSALAILLWTCFIFFVIISSSVSSRAAFPSVMHFVRKNFGC